MCSSTPPSPPQRLLSPVPPAYRVTFSLGKRKRTIEDTPSRRRKKQPLGDITHNVRQTPRIRLNSALKQTQIDLGGESRKSCTQCGMEYIPSNSEDNALHRKFHDLGSAGIEVGKVFTKDVATRLVAPHDKTLQESETVFMVDRRSSGISRNKVKQILDVVNSQLSSPPIDDDVLWRGLEPTRRIAPNRKTSRRSSDSCQPRFKAFVYLVNDSCVGCCLMENITTGYKVVTPAADGLRNRDIVAHGHSSSISISDKPEAVLLGVSRIWTSRLFRRRGIAQLLLDCGRTNFFYGLEVTKNLVAFSQPTESGARLARKWYGRQAGWHVFKDEPQRIYLKSNEQEAHLA